MSIRKLFHAGVLALPVMFVMPASPAVRADTTTAVRRSFATMPPEPWAQADPADSLYKAAREAMNRNEFRRAATLFAQIADKYPKSEYAADSYYWRAFALYRAGREEDFRDAMTSIETQKKRFPKAKTIGDSEELSMRIRGELAKRGDAKSAEEVSSAASASVQCTRDDGEDGIRTAALNALMQMESRNALPILKQVLSKRDACSANLRKKAVFILSQHQSAEVVSLMIDVIKNDPARAVREDAVFWLGHVDSDVAASFLENLALTSNDSRLQEKAVFALGQQGGARGDAFIRRIATSSDVSRSVREQAIWQVGQQRSPENAEFLKTLFGRVAGSDELQKKILFSLSQMQGMGNDRWLLGIAMDRAHSIEVRKHALWCAGQNNIPSSELVSLYDRLTDAPMKEQLIWVLSDSRGSAGTDKLVEIAQKDPDREMRKKAIFWLGQKNDPRIVKILTDIITKP
jgi:HEAT repeat protein